MSAMHLYIGHSPHRDHIVKCGNVGARESVCTADLDAVTCDDCKKSAKKEAAANEANRKALGGFFSRT